MSWTFFVDRDLGRHILPGILEAAGMSVERHHDHFAPDAVDELWLPVVAANGWIVLSGDQRPLRRPLEVAAIRAAKAIVLILVGNHATTGVRTCSRRRTEMGVEPGQLSREQQYRSPVGVDMCSTCNAC